MTPYIGKILLFALLCALTAWFTAPDFSTQNIKLPDPQQIGLVEGEAYDQPTIISTTGQLREKVSSAKKPPYRQIHFAIPRHDKAVFLIAPSLPVETSLWVNGIPQGNSLHADYQGPGLGAFTLRHTINPIYLGSDRNRIDLYAQEGFPHSSKPMLWIMSAQNSASDAYILDKALTQMRLGALVCGGLGLVFSFFGMLFARDRLVFIGGGAVCLALLAHALGYIPMPTRLVLAGGGAIFVLIRSMHKSWLTKGAALAAVMAVGISIWTMMNSQIVNLAPAYFSSMMLWPLTGLAIPIMAVNAANVIWQQFVSSQARLKEQETIIAQQETDLKESIRVQAIHEERQRFVRDMHDGVGGTLLSLLMRVRSKKADSVQIEEELQTGLNDLRLMADSLDHVGSDLDTALAAFERRARQQLMNTEVEFQWSKPDDLSDVKMDVRAVLNLYRIMQEALTNCIRHSNASLFATNFAIENNSLLVTISDDGKGFDTGKPEGRGLNNIRKRAEHLGAKVQWAKGDPRGMVLHLTIPQR